ncbi:transport system permease protein [Candidatus Magnetoovum chiemensis]|nr:transport system permease protein [Candidatus Magnetoovum chiemensis]
MKLILLAALVISMILAICGGAVNVDFLNLSEIDKNILLNVRLPRVMLAGLVGASLALSGALFQYVMKNPLADSFTTGVSASSAMAAVIAIVLGISGLIPLFALAGGLIGLYLVYKIASHKGMIQPITMLLAGIVLSTCASAVISLMKYLSDDAVSSVIFWLMGGFQAATFSKDAALFIALAIAFLTLRHDSLRLDLLCFDDTTASSSGVDVNRLRKKIFFAAALLSSFSVAYSGIIGFVGLIVPHILRLAGQIRAAKLIPASILFGASFMIITDLIARTILTQGEELPVGIITSSIGGGFFLYLLIKRKKELYYFD